MIRRSHPSFHGFSMPWKIPAHVFHAMENSGPRFPRHGNFFSMPWKTLSMLAALRRAGCARQDGRPTALPDGQPAAATATLSTNRIRIGDPVDLTIAVLHRDGTTAQFPAIARGRDVLVRSTNAAVALLPNGLKRTEQHVRFTSMTVSNHVVGADGNIVISTPEGLHWEVPFPFVALEVESALQPGERDPRPLKDDALARWPAPARRILPWILAGLALLAAAAVAIRRVLASPKTFFRPAPPPPPPHRVALDAIDALRARGWIEAGNAEPFYVELSSIVRAYVEGRFGLRAPERTTEEFIREAAASGQLEPAHRERVAGFLEQSDLVKFARHVPGAGDMRHALDSALRLVRDTMPAEPSEIGAPQEDA